MATKTRSRRCAWGGGWRGLAGCGTAPKSMGCRHQLVARCIRARAVDRKCWHGPCWPLRGVNGRMFPGGASGPVSALACIGRSESGQGSSRLMCGSIGPRRRSTRLLHRPTMGRTSASTPSSAPHRLGKTRPPGRIGLLVPRSVGPTLRPAYARLARHVNRDMTVSFMRTWGRSSISRAMASAPGPQEGGQA